jgi:hypothetical protein
MNDVMRILIILGATLLLIGIITTMIQADCYNKPIDEYFNSPMCRVVNGK